MRYFRIRAVQESPISTVSSAALTHSSHYRSQHPWMKRDEDLKLLSFHKLVQSASARQHDPCLGGSGETKRFLGCLARSGAHTHPFNLITSILLQHTHSSTLLPTTFIHLATRSKTFSSTMAAHAPYNEDLRDRSGHRRSGESRYNFSSHSDAPRGRNENSRRSPPHLSRRETLHGI